MADTRVRGKAGLIAGVLLLVIYCLTLIVVDVENYKNGLLYKNRADANQTLYVTDRKSSFTPLFPWVLQKTITRHGGPHHLQSEKSVESSTNETATNTVTESTATTTPPNNTGRGKGSSVRPMRVQSKCVKRKCKVNSTTETNSL
jgi:hypothetical protein